MTESLSINSQDVNQMRVRYFYEYGTTLNGLMKHHNVDPIDYLEFVHDIPLEDFIVPNQILGDFFEKASSTNVIFSNAYYPYIKKILSLLSVDEYFDNIHDIVDFEFTPKPFALPYKKVIEKYRFKPEDIILIDDSVPNLNKAKEFNMKTIFVGNKKMDEFDFSINKIEDIIDIYEKLIDF